VSCRCVLQLLTLMALCLQLVSVSAEDTDEVHRGARIYLERCSLCHGSKGLGEGPMALLIRGYPDTRLKTVEEADRSVRSIVEFGASSESVSSLSPPWRDELAVAEIEAVSTFVEVLRNDFGRATEVLASVNVPPERIDGRKIYRARCEGCHGATGKGDGRMSRVIRNPPPTDLTQTTLSHQETIAIISAGGKAVGRSERMPPWGQELVNAELLSVANYLATLRVGEDDLVGTE